MGLRAVAVGVLIAAATAWGDTPDALRPPRMGPPPRPAKGKLLVATRQIDDPRFSESVVLLVAHDAEGGAMGVIVNKPTPIDLARILPQFESLAGRGERVWRGGPVLPTSLLVLQRSAEADRDTEIVFDDVRMLTSRDAMERLFANTRRLGRFRAYAGHAGWAPGQLEAEIARGDWLVVPGKTDVVFSESPEGVWLRLLERSEGQWTLLRPINAPGS